MKRRLVFGFVIVLLALNLAVGAGIYLSSSHGVSAPKDNPSASLDLFASVLQKVRTSYVDATNLTYHTLVYSAVKGMVNTLDPHSEFLDAQDYRRLQDDTQGEFGGLGLVVS